MRFVIAKSKNDGDKDKRQADDQFSPSSSTRKEEDHQPHNLTDDSFFPVHKLYLLVSSSCSYPEALASNKTHRHLVLYVQTDPVSNTGYIHHVTGSISSPEGLIYTWQPFSPSNPSIQSHDQTQGVEQVVDGSQFLGLTGKSTYPEAWETSLRSVPAPRQQISMNHDIGKEQVVRSWSDGVAVEFWEDGEGPDVVGCVEWVEMGAIPTLQTGGLILGSVV